MNIEETLLNDLKWRGLLHTITPDVDLRKPMTVYLGVDPTAASLHIGSLLPVICLNKFIAHGHKVILLMGDGTAMIGDPSGKKSERPMLSNESVDINKNSIEAQLKRLVPGATIKYNSEWLQGLSYMGFLRTVGKHISVNYMRAKDSVRAREEAGISYAEFSYMLLQAYDFLHLWENHGCALQLGGSDQWGNITCGIELIKRKAQGEAHGLTFPLLVGSNGEKFGKTASGAVWLDPIMTSPYHFHQFWLNTGDDVVIQYLKYFTTLPQEHIQNIEELMGTYASERVAQKTLADAVTRLVHGEAALLRTNQLRELLFGNGGDLSSITQEEMSTLFDSDIQRGPVELPETGIRLTDLCEQLGVYNSKGEARRAIEGGGLYLNGLRVENPVCSIHRSDLLHDKHIILRKGKKEYFVVTLDPVAAVVVK